MKGAPGGVGKLPHRVLPEALIAPIDEELNKRIAEGKPWENAYVEAQHRIDQERLYDAMRVGSREEGIATLTVYQDESNWYPKPCLGMKSPMDMIGETV